MLPHETDVQREIAIAYGAQITAMNALHDAVVGMLTCGGWTVRHSKRIQRFTAETMMGLLVKACKTFRAAQVLCERGLHADAKVSVRALLETTVAIAFILQKRPNERALIYHAYGLAQQLKMLEEWRRTPGLKRFARDATLSRIREGVADYMRRLPPGTNVSRHWSGTGGLQDAMRALRNDVAYASLYRHTSAIAHSADFGSHFQLDASTGDFIWEIEPTVTGFEAPSVAARQLLWYSANRINEKLGLGFAAALAAHKLTRSDVVAGEP